MSGSAVHHAARRQSRGSSKVGEQGENAGRWEGESDLDGDGEAGAQWWQAG